jgi:glycosyltransferase involved in cell wall biosynthesis
MRIALIGARGIPDHYASAEQLVRHLGRYLVDRGHEFTVYCHAYRFEDRAPEWNGIRRIFIPTVRDSKYLTQPVHALLSSADAIRRNYDLLQIQFLNNAYQSVIPRLFGQRIVTNVNGQIWDDPKWPRPLRGIFFKSAARVAMAVSRQIITDAVGIADIYRRWYGKESAIIEYGADIRSSREPERVAKYGLAPGEYYFVAARMVPSNQADVIVDGFTRSGSDRELVLAGGQAFGSAWFENLRRRAGSRVRFLGPVADQDDLEEIYCNAYAYLHGATLGGINSALLRPLGCGIGALAYDTVYNREVIEMRDGGRCGEYWRTADELAALIRALDADETRARELGRRGQQRIAEAFTWERIGRQYELFYEMVLDDEPIERIRDAVAAV